MFSHLCHFSEINKIPGKLLGPCTDDVKRLEKLPLPGCFVTRLPLTAAFNVAFLLSKILTRTCAAIFPAVWLFLFLIYQISKWWQLTDKSAEVLVPVLFYNRAIIDGNHMLFISYVLIYILILLFKKKQCVIIIRTFLNTIKICFKIGSNTTKLNKLV